MRWFKRYVRFHLSGLWALWRRAMARTDKRVFAALFTVTGLLTGSGSRLRWQDGVFVVTDRRWPGVRQRFRHRVLGAGNYQLGLARHARGFGAAYFLDRIDFKDGDVFIDCGANVGNARLWLRQQGLQVRYIGFEPSPVEFACLAANVVDCPGTPGRVFQVGLWNREGVMKFYVSSKHGDSSLIEPKRYDEVVEVQAKRLESYLKEPVKCLKLEAEGAEPEILEGCGDKLRLVEYIAANVDFERGVKEESTLAPVTNFLLSRGFELVVLRGVVALYRNKEFGSER